MLTPSTILDVIYLSVPIVDYRSNSLPHFFLFSHIITLGCTLDEKHPLVLFCFLFDFSGTGNTFTPHTGDAFNSISHQPISLLNLCIMHLQGIDLALFCCFFSCRLSPSYFSLHCVTFSPPLLTQNPYRKMPLIATLALDPFQFTSFLFLPAFGFCLVFSNQSLLFTS